MRRLAPYSDPPRTPGRPRGCPTLRPGRPRPTPASQARRACHATACRGSLGNSPHSPCHAAGATVHRWDDRSTLYCPARASHHRHSRDQGSNAARSPPGAAVPAWVRCGVAGTRAAGGRARGPAHRRHRGGLQVRPGNGFESLERLRGGGRGLDGLCGEATHRLGQASCSLTNNHRSPKTTSW